MKNQILAYLESTINQYRRAYEETSSNTLKYMICDLEDFETFIEDLNNEPSKSTLELNADLRNNARAYQNDLAEKECTITTLTTDLYNFGYIEKENKMLEADNLKLNNQLVLQETKRKELFQECCEAEIENGKYIMEIQDLKSDNQMWQAKCIELREKLEKATKCQWWID